MGVDIYYFYHGFGLKAFEGRTNRIVNREYVVSNHFHSELTLFETTVLLKRHDPANQLVVKHA